jgi:hypothetical protein
VTTSLEHLRFVRRAVTWCVTSVTVLAPTLVHGQITNRVVVPSTAFGAITVIDTAMNTIVGTPTNTVGEADVAVTPDGRSILVVNAALGTLTR